MRLTELIPSSSAFRLWALRSGTLTFSLFRMDWPAKARSRISIFSNMDIWAGLPQTETRSISSGLAPMVPINLSTVSMTMRCPTSGPFSIQKCRWSMMLAPGSGCLMVMAVARILPFLSRSTRCPR